MRSSDPPPWAGHSGLPILVGLGSGLTRPPWAGQHQPIITVPLSRLVRSPRTHCRGLPPWQPSRIVPSPSVTSGPLLLLLLHAGTAATRPGALGLLAAVAARPTVLASTTERKAVHPVEVVPAAADRAETAALARVAVRTPLGQALLRRRSGRRRLRHGRGAGSGWRWRFGSRRWRGHGWRRFHLFAAAVSRGCVVLAPRAAYGCAAAAFSQPVVDLWLVASRGRLLTVFCFV